MIEQKDTINEITEIIKYINSHRTISLKSKIVNDNLLKVLFILEELKLINFETDKEQNINVFNNQTLDEINEFLINQRIKKLKDGSDKEC